MQHKNIHIIKGKGSVLLSAPHAVSIRKTVDNRTYTRKAEKRADEVVKALCEKNHAWGVFTVSEEGPINDWQNSVYDEYKKIVSMIMKEHSVSLFIDIHGAKKTRPFYIDYDFLIPGKHPHDGLVEDLFCKTFAAHFPATELSTRFYRKVKGEGKKTLTYYVRKRFGIPAIQLEINKNIKEDDKKFQQLVDMLYSFIEAYENTFVGLQQEKEVLHNQKTS